MTAPAMIAYYRVSTARQADSGLGVEAQRATVAGFLRRQRGELIAEFVEAESGARNDRPKLAEALRLCRIYRATLVIARLDRLSRNAAMIAELMESGVDFVAADMPLANRFTIHIVAAVAEYELKLISERIRGALAVAKLRGRRVGGIQRADFRDYLVGGTVASNEARRRRMAARAADLTSTLCELRDAGLSTYAISVELTRRRIPTLDGGAKWKPKMVLRAFSLAGSDPPARRRPPPPRPVKPPQAAGSRARSSG